MLLTYVLICALSSNVWSLTLDDLIEDTAWMPTTNQVDQRLGIFDETLLKFEEVINFSRSAFSDKEEENGPVDCFGLSPMLQKIFGWLFQPQDESVINVKFFLTTREDRSRVEWSEEQGGSFGLTPFRSDKSLVVLVHGFMSNSDMFWVKDMTNALLDKSDVNVVAVDWGGGSLSWKYWRAVGNTRVVGQQLCQFLHKLLIRGLTRAQIHCIGHSLGAHICSFAAKKLGIFGRITGLDPAQPCFRGNGLNVSDALYVDVVHTNTYLFGRSEILGSKDFFPNGGRMQPGCALKDSKILANFPITRKKLEAAICSHGRSYEYFIDALRNRNCQFWGRLWDRSRDGALKAMQKTCSPMTCVPMGLESKQFPGKGSYFVPTSEKTPFCLPENDTTLVMQAWNMVMKKFKINLKNIRKRIIGV